MRGEEETFRDADNEEDSFEGPTVEDLTEEADIAADYIEDFLDTINYNGDIEVGVRHNRAFIDIIPSDEENNEDDESEDISEENEGSTYRRRRYDIDNLIGYHGEVLDSLQRLVRLAVQQKTGERSHLIVDVNGYRKRKLDRLKQIALEAVEEVKETGEAVDLRDMNSYDRKMVHDLVRAQGLRSRSHGEEPHRHVTVYIPADKSYEDDEALEEADEYDDDGSFSQDYE